MMARPLTPILTMAASGWLHLTMRHSMGLQLSVKLGSVQVRLHHMSMPVLYQ
jgi:hypothetical protein